jgi:O-antigen ligase
MPASDNASYRPAPIEARRESGPREYILLVGIGLFAATLATVTGSTSTRLAVLTGAGIAALGGIACIRDPDLLARMVVVGLALSIPINLDVNFLYRPHVGGAPSVTVNLTVLGIAVFFALWAYRTAVGLQARIVVVHRPIALSMCALLAVTPLSLANASHPELVALEWLRLAILAAAMLAIMSLQRPDLVRVWVAALSVQIVLQASIACAQYLARRSLGLDMFGEQVLQEQDIGRMVSRPTGTIGNPNMLGYFFEILLPLTFAMALTRQNPRVRAWYALATAIGLAGMLVTLSRGAWVTLPVSFGLVFALVYGRRALRLKSVVGALLVGTVLVAAIALAYPTIHKRFTHDDRGSTSVRMPLNQAAWSIIERHPVIGIGLNNFAEAFKREDQTGHSRLFRGYRHVVHNLHLWIWAETGTAGLLAYLAPFAVTFAVALRIRRRVPPVERAIVVGLAAGLLAHLLHGLVDPGFRISLSVSLLVFTSMGTVAAIAAQRTAPRSH